MSGKEITLEIKRPEVFILLAFLILILFIEVQVTMNSPIAFGDEAFHTYSAKTMAKNQDYYLIDTLHSTKLEIEEFNRPPLWNLLEASFYMIFGFSEVIVKFLTPFISLLTGLGVFALLRKMYSRNIALITACLIVAVPSIVTYAVLFYVDTLLVLFVSLSVFLTFLAIKEEKIKYWAIAGILSGFSILTKITGYVIIIPFLLLCFLYLLIKKRNVLGTIKPFAILAIALMLVVGPFWIRNLRYFGTLDCGLPTFSIFNPSCGISFDYTPKYQFIGNEAAVNTAANIFNSGIIGYLEFIYGSFSLGGITFAAFWLIPLLFFCGLMILKKYQNGILFLFILLPFLLVFYRTSGGRVEDLARYMLPSITFIAAVAAIYVGNIIDFIKKYKSFLGIAIIIAILFVSFMNAKTKADTMMQVKQFSPLFFEACNWVKANTKPDIIMLSLYAHPTSYQCERNSNWGLKDLPDIMISYDLNLSTSRLGAHGITHIFVQKFALTTEKYSQGYTYDFVNFLNQNSEVFEKIFENGPDLDTCKQQGCDGSIIYEINYTAVK